MTSYQTSKSAELTNLGWVASGSQPLAGVRGQQRETIFRFTNQSGVRAYIYPTWVQFIN